jgi:hypothetical protein
MSGFVLRNKPMIDFDVNNPEHIRAIAVVLNGGQVSETDLRFAVEPPFTSVPTMAMFKMAQEYAKMKGINIEVSESNSLRSNTDAAVVFISKRKKQPVPATA